MKKPLLFAVCALACTLGLNRPAEARKILVDVNQFMLSDYNELMKAGSSARLRCDGIWSVMGTSNINAANTPAPGDKWRTIANYIGTGHIVSEDQYNNTGDYALTLSRLGRVDTSMVYHEPEVTLVGGEMDAAAASHGGKVLVLSRNYTSYQATQVNNALNNAKVTGVAFEIETQPNDGTAPATEVRNRKFAAGAKAALAKGKKAYFLMSPGKTNLGSGYKSAIIASVSALKADMGSQWSSSNLYVVLAAYEIGRTKVKFFGGGSVEDALIWLKTQ